MQKRIEYARAGGGGRGGGSRGGSSRGGSSRGGAGSGGNRGGGSSRGGSSGNRGSGGSNSSRSSTLSSARSAANSGTFNRATAQSLRQAGVNQSKIASLRSLSRDVATRNATSAQATANTNSNIASAIDGQWSQGLNIGADFYNSPSFQNVLGQNLNADGSKMSEAAVAKYAMDKGYGLGDKYMAAFGTTSAPRQAKNIRHAIKIAASNDALNSITRAEGRNIYNSFRDSKNLNPLKFTGILDRMNVNYESKGLQPIGLTGGFMNLLGSGKLGSMPYESLFATDSPFMPTGGLSKTLAGMNKTGKFSKGDVLYGLMNNGEYRTTPGAGKPWAKTKWAGPETTVYTPFAERPAVSDNTTTPTEELPPEEALPEEEAPKEDKGANQFGDGSNIPSFAAGWKARRGTRAKAGRSAQGFASMRIAPAYSAGVGTNYG